MHKERLLKLADLLEADAANTAGIKFDLGCWAAPSDEDRPWEGKVVPVSCDTTACAVGLACISGAFQAEGLGFKIEYEALSPVFGELAEWKAVKSFFGISGLQAEYLFMDTSYDDEPTEGADGERVVAQRIRDFVAGLAGPYL